LASIEGWDQHKPMEFISAATDLPQKCATCCHYKECEFKWQCMTRQENSELGPAEKCLKLEVEAKK
jgi:hypothetical protein